MYQRVLFFILLSLNISSYSQEVSIAFTKSMAPYLVSPKKSGIEYEIVAEALKSQGFTLATYKNLHYKRAIKLLAKKQVDIVVSNRDNNLYFQKKVKIYSSDVTLNYVDCAISLKKRNLSYDKMVDYSDKTVWAFKSAKEVLGSEFKKAVSLNKNYTESYDQNLMVNMLAKERVDIVISDKNIFLNLLEKALGPGKIDLFTYKKIIPITPRNIKTHDAKLKETFNKGLKLIKENGVYEKILKKYKNQYDSKC